MNILVGKCFGIGNAVMAIPMIRALQMLPDTRVDVLVGNTSDDVGAINVLSKVVGGPGNLYVNTALERHYDVAVMAIPFDGRWRNGVHFNADRVLDGRTRPDPSTTGLVSWKKHEVLYQMENAYALGYSGEPPALRFLSGMRYAKRVYVGVGYKKDAAGFWKIKHWGNENYAALITNLIDSDPEINVVATGDIGDFQHSIGPISRIVSSSRFAFKCSSNLDQAFNDVADCSVYVGNDTGMMHVAAAAGLDVCGIFSMENAYVKNRPWIKWGKYDFSFQTAALAHGQVLTPEVVADAVRRRISCTSSRVD